MPARGDVVKVQSQRVRSAVYRGFVLLVNEPMALLAVWDERNAEWLRVPVEIAELKRANPQAGQCVHCADVLSTPQASSAGRVGYSWPET